VDVKVAAAAAQAALAVPLAAVRRAAYGDHVYVIGKAGRDGRGLRAEQRFVQTGPVVGTDIIIVKGLAEGEQVATEGSFKLSQGSLVRIADPAPQSGGKPPGS